MSELTNLPIEMLRIVCEYAGPTATAALARTCRTLIVRVRKAVTEHGLLERFLQRDPFVRAHYKELKLTLVCSSGLESLARAHADARMFRIQLNTLRPLCQRVTDHDWYDGAHPTAKITGRMGFLARDTLATLALKMSQGSDLGQQVCALRSLHQAELPVISAVLGSCQAVRELFFDGVESRCDAALKDDSLVTALCRFRYREEGVHGLLKDLLAQGWKADVTALAWATRRGKWDIAELLVEHGVNPRASCRLLNQPEVTPVSLALDLGHGLDKLRQVFNWGIQPAKEVLHPCETHALWSRWDLFSHPDFLAFQLDPNAQYEWNNRCVSPLRTVLSSLGADTTNDELREAIRALVAMGLDCNSKVSDPLLPFLIPGLRKCSDRWAVIEELVTATDARRCDVSLASAEDWTPLELVAHEGHWRAFQFLCKHGARDRANVRHPLLHLLVTSKADSKTVIAFLEKLEQTKNLDRLASQRDAEGYTALERAAAAGRVDVCAWLLNRGRRCSEDSAAAEGTCLVRASFVRVVDLASRRLQECCPLATRTLDEEMAALLGLFAKHGLVEVNDELVFKMRDSGFFGPSTLVAFAEIARQAEDQLLCGVTTQTGLAALVHRKDVHLLERVCSRDVAAIRATAEVLLLEALKLSPTATLIEQDQTVAIAKAILRLMSGPLCQSLATQALHQFLESELEDQALLAELVGCADLNAVDSGGRTALKLALVHRAPEEQIRLLYRGVEQRPNDRDVAEFAMQHCSDESLVDLAMRLNRKPK